MSRCCYGPRGYCGQNGYVGKTAEYVKDHPGKIANRTAFCYVDGNLLFDKIYYWDEQLDNSKWYQDFHKHHKVVAAIVSIPISTVRFVLQKALGPVISAVSLVALPLIGACGTAKRAYYYAAGWALWEIAKYGIAFVVFYYIVPHTISLYVLAAYYGLGLIGKIFEGLLDPVPRRRDFIFEATVNDTSRSARTMNAMCPGCIANTQREASKQAAKEGLNAMIAGAAENIQAGRRAGAF